MLRVLFLTLCLGVCLTAQAAQRSVPLQESGTLQFAGPERELPWVKRDIILAANSLGWLPTSSTETSVNLRRVLRSHTLDIQVFFTGKTFSIGYLNSENLGHAVTPEGQTLIHPSYNRWVAELIARLHPKGAVDAAAGEPAAPLPEGMLAIHYHRPKRDWGDWGAHVWGTAIEHPTSWFAPVRHTRADAFGAVYLLRAGERKADQAYDAFYVLHNGELKDQCGEDMQWDVARSREIYVVQGDCDVYYSLQDALRSKKLR